MQAHERQILEGPHYVELFAVLLPAETNSIIAQRQWWWELIECCCVINTTTKIEIKWLSRHPSKVALFSTTAFIYTYNNFTYFSPPSGLIFTGVTSNLLPVLDVWIFSFQQNFSIETTRKRLRLEQYGDLFQRYAQTLKMVEFPPANTPSSCRVHTFSQCR